MHLVNNIVWGEYMSSGSDISDIIFDAYRDLMAGYATLLRGLRYLDNMINCLDRAIEQGKKCTTTNYKLCVRLVLEELDPCYLNNLIPFFEYVGSEFEKVMKSAEWITGGRGSSAKFLSEISSSISKPILKSMTIIDFIIALARTEGGMAEKEDLELVESFYPKIAELLKRRSAYISKPRDIFFAKPFTTLILYLIHWLTVLRDTLQSQANLLRARAYEIVKETKFLL